MYSRISASRAVYTSNKESVPAQPRSSCMIRRGQATGYGDRTTTVITAAHSFTAPPAILHQISSSRTYEQRCVTSGNTSAPLVAAAMAEGDDRTAPSCTDRDQVQNNTEKNEEESAALDVITAHITQTGGCNLRQATPAVEAAVSTLTQIGSSKEGVAAESLDKGAGRWEVFYMPHIRRIAEPLRIDVQPLRYTITSDLDIVSDVHYDAPLLGAGWLNSGGSVAGVAGDAAAVKVKFNSFWVGADSAAPRPPPPAGAQGRSPVDAAIDSLGNLAFFEEFSRFPVLYFDDEAGVCVFQFPPLKSSIAAYRVGPA